MADHTPADKPDLPALPPMPPELLLATWVRGQQTGPYTVNGYNGHQMLEYGRQCAYTYEAWARADERRKALEFAAASIDEIDDGAAPEYRACQEHIRSKIDRKEPTK